jgi:hypothetical protein
VKEFLVYTGLRALLFAACFAVLALVWWAIWDTQGLLIWPFVLAVVISSLLSLRLLQGPRERFAQRVEARASRAAARFEEMRAREDDAEARDADQRA